MKDEIKEILEEMIDNEKLINVENDYERIIFEYLANNCSEFDDEHIKQLVNLKVEQYKQLFDYITNLKEENQKLKELCDKYEKEHSTTFNEWKETITDKYQTLKNLQEENESLKAFKDESEYWENQWNYLYKRYYDYKLRNEKAIEYIHNHQPVFELSNKKQIQKWFEKIYYIELLNILNGGDEE